ncbi:MAG: right-handed parallel beta-helix repeat-containing protein, partial [Candidatus Thermoplasmatota archaeon]|nr:right-handed parallel beta-helix repeat-containing protein [Candidatus Thermoplasmatota archaeon]
MAVGNGIYVEDGTLEILGQPNRKVWMQTITAGTWSGIYANEDSTIKIRWADIRFADTGLELMGTGHSASSGSVAVNNTSFTTCTTGILADANGYSPPFNFTFKDNSLSNSDNSVYLGNGYNGITIENNNFYKAKKTGIYTTGVGSLRIRNNTLTECQYGIQMGMTITENIVENNTVSNCYIGFLGAFLGNAKFMNNSIFTKSKGIFMPLVVDLLIENNTVTSIGGFYDVPIEISDDDGLSTIKNNILSGCGPMIVANGSTPLHYDIYDNLLLNLTELKYVDSMGDGFVDIDVPCAGSVGAKARTCRTSVFYTNQPGIVESYVTPKQASEHARVGSTLKMISNPVGYGPKNLEAREIYHTQLPVIEWPMNFTGEEMEMLIFQPGVCMPSASIQDTSYAGLNNFTVKGGITTVNVVNSNNVSLFNIRSLGHTSNSLRGAYIDGSQDITIEDCLFKTNYDYSLSITSSRRISITDSSITNPLSFGVRISDSVDVKGDNTSITFTNHIGMYCDGSQVSWNG